MKNLIVIHGEYAYKVEDAFLYRAPFDENPGADFLEDVQAVRYSCFEPHFEEVTKPTQGEREIWRALLALGRRLEAIR